MKLIKNNAGWFSAGLGALFILLGWASGLFGIAVEIAAEPAIDQKIYTHELVIEPRLRSLEDTAGHNQEEIVKVQQKLDDSLLIQREILKEVKK